MLTPRAVPQASVQLWPNEALLLGALRWRFVKYVQLRVVGRQRILHLKMCFVSLLWMRFYKFPQVRRWHFSSYSSLMIALLSKRNTLASIKSQINYWFKEIINHQPGVRQQVYTGQEMHFPVRISMMDFITLEQGRISGQNDNSSFCLFVCFCFAKGMFFTATEQDMLFIGNKRFY